MTSPTLKDVLVDALNASLASEDDYPDVHPIGAPLSAICRDQYQAHADDDLIIVQSDADPFYGVAFAADRLAQAITDHLTPIKVWDVTYYAETVAIFRSKEKAEAYLAAYLAERNYPGLEEWCDVSEIIIHDDASADRLIECLAGKASDA